MSPHEPRSGPPVLTFHQLLGSALAAAAAAFGASYLGVAGTIIGAALASVIATVASAMYSRSLQRTREVVQTTVTQWGRPATLPAVPDPDAPSGPRARRTPVVRLAGAAVAVMALTFGALTGVESVLGQPIASLLGGSDAAGTTLGSVGGATTSDRTPRRHRAELVSPTPTPSPVSTPSPDPTPTAPATPTLTPTDPAGTTSGPTSGTTTAPVGTPTGTPAG